MKHSSQKSHFQTKQISIGQCSKFTRPMRNQHSRCVDFTCENSPNWNSKCNRTLNQSVKRIMEGMHSCQDQSAVIYREMLWPKLRRSLFTGREGMPLHLNVNKWLWVVNLEVRGHPISLLLLSLAERNVGGRSVQCKPSSTFSHTHTHTLAAD